jgi:hypothetical protein
MQVFRILLQIVNFALVGEGVPPSGPPSKGGDSSPLDPLKEGKSFPSLNLPLRKEGKSFPSLDLPLENF